MADAFLFRALVLLALVLFAAVPPPAAQTPDHDPAYLIVAADPGAFCGDDPRPDHSDHSGHAPCHLCRLGGDAVLPPPHCDTLRVRHDPARIIFAGVAEENRFVPPRLAPQGRAPPVST